MDTKEENSRKRSLSSDSKEEAANAAIQDLIDRFKILLENKHSLVSGVKSPKMLLSSLQELQNMVELSDIKQSIVDQIMLLLVNKQRSSSASMEGHMLHSVISGRPGTGKTTVANILAKIWTSLGLIKKRDTSPTPAASSVNDLFNVLVQQNAIINLDMNNRLNLIKLEAIAAIVKDNIITLNNLRRTASSLQDDNLEEKKKNINQLVRKLRFAWDEISELAEVGTKEKKEEPEEEAKFTVATRDQLIGQYLGETAIKTKKILESARGGVLFIDEAYSLCYHGNGSHDKYGEECLTTINEFMSLYSDEIIIIFAGYKEKLLNSIFKVQPGLHRRVAWFFEISDYTSKGLAEIFHRQLRKHKWILSSDIDLPKLLDKYSDVLQDNGGSTEKIAFYVKLEYARQKFQSCVDNDMFSHDNIVTMDMMEKALQKYASQVDDRKKEDDEPPFHMYI